MTIDVDALREVGRDACSAAFFGGGIGPALLEACDAERASPEELIAMAQRWGVDVRKFQID